MATTTTLNDALDAVERLAPEDQEYLVELVKRRLAERGRARIMAEVEEAEREFAEGKCVPKTVEEIMRDITS